MTILSSLTSGNTPRAPSNGNALPLISMPMMVVKPAPLFTPFGARIQSAVRPGRVFREKGAVF